MADDDPRFPEDKRRRTCGLSIEKPSGERSFPVAYSARGTVASQPLTPSVALPFEGRARLATTTASSKDGDFSEPERLRSASCPFRLLSLGGEGQRADVCNRYDSRARPGSPEPHLRVPEVALATRLDGWPRPFRGLASRASLDQGFDMALAGRTPPGRDRSRPNMVTPLLVARTPSVASS